nr:superoxide dismutase family protein [Luteirhabdus pelagi]
MKRISLLVLFAATTLFVSCNDGNKKDSDADETMTEENMDSDVEETDMKMEEEIKEVTFELESKSNSSATGKVSFVETNGQVKMTAKITGLEPGEHAIHIHEKADCSAPDGKSAGGHWNPTFDKHGQWGDPEGYHKGDIGNFMADENGDGTVSMTTDEWCIGCDDEKKNILGKSIIVHQGADDFTSQPSGAAGARVSCGGIIQM